LGHPDLYVQEVEWGRTGEGAIAQANASVLTYTIIRSTHMKMQKRMYIQKEDEAYGEDP
jgi:hypothetical protein